MGAAFKRLNAFAILSLGRGDEPETQFDPHDEYFRLRVRQLKSEHLLLVTLSHRSTIDTHIPKTMMEVDVRKFAVGVVSAAAMLAFGVPATAQSYGWQDHHAQEHEQLDAEHHDTHDQLGDEHADAH